MNKYRVSYKEDFHTIIEETEITCSEKDIRRLANEYYEENKERLADVIGVDWSIIEE